jgi:choline dehydrogenase-like flavoprotein
VTRTYRDSEAVDFLIVGSGAAGGVMARELARAGFAVVVMEQGPRLRPQDFEHDELKYWLANGITNDPSVSPQTYRKTPADAATKDRAGTDKCTLVCAHGRRQQRAFYRQLLALPSCRFQGAQRARRSARRRIRRLAD